MLQLLGKVIVAGTIKAETGLRIGGTSGGLKIGGLDLNVITDQNGKPYLPGSSIKGKLRSLLEQKESNGKSDFYNDGQHSCTDEESYKKCPICKIWGTIKDRNFKSPSLTRLIVRDSFLNDDKAFWETARENIDLNYTEVKIETAIDRVKGTAKDKTLRQIERVPAGATFGFQCIFNVFDESDKDLLKKLFEAMALLENDYLGGMGSRGYGHVSFNNISVFWNSKTDYENGTTALDATRAIQSNATPSSLVQNFSILKNNLARTRQ